MTQLGSKQIKLVMEALKEKPLARDELVQLGLKQKNHISERQMDRILVDYLKEWGFIKKLDDGRWAWTWYERSLTYKTKDEYNLALKHSEILLIGLRAILDEQLNLSLELTGSYGSIGKNTAERQELKPYAEEHLKKGYPKAWEKVEAFRKPLVRWAQLEKRAISPYGLAPYALDIRKLDWRQRRDKKEQALEDLRKDSEFKKVIQQRVEGFQALANEILAITLKVKMGEPLQGACKGCPNIHIQEN